MFFIHHHQEGLLLNSKKKTLANATLSIDPGLFEPGHCSARGERGGAAHDGHGGTERVGRRARLCLLRLPPTHPQRQCRRQHLNNAATPVAQRKRSTIQGTPRPTETSPGCQSVLGNIGRQRSVPL